jgi:hypothetical protein
MYLTELSFEFEKIYINHSDDYPTGEQFPEAAICGQNEEYYQIGKGWLALLATDKEFTRRQSTNDKLFLIFPQLLIQDGAEVY